MRNIPMSIKAHRKRQYSIIIDVFSVMLTFSVNEQDTDALRDFMVHRFLCIVYDLFMSTVYVLFFRIFFGILQITTLYTKEKEKRKITKLLHNLNNFFYSHFISISNQTKLFFFLFLLFIFINTKSLNSMIPTIDNIKIIFNIK